MKLPGEPSARELLEALKRWEAERPDEYRQWQAAARRDREEERAAWRELLDARRRVADLEAGYRERWGLSDDTTERAWLAEFLERDAVLVLLEIGCLSESVPPIPESADERSEWLHALPQPSNARDATARAFAADELWAASLVRAGETLDAMMALLLGSGTEGARGLGKAIRALSASRAAGAKGGRPPKIAPAQRARLREMAARARADRPASGVAAEIGAALGIDLSASHLAALVRQERPRKPRIPRAARHKGS